MDRSYKYLYEYINNITLYPENYKIQFEEKIMVNCMNKSYRDKVPKQIKYIKCSHVAGEHNNEEYIEDKYKKSYTISKMSIMMNKSKELCNITREFMLMILKENLLDNIEDYPNDNRIDVKQKILESIRRSKINEKINTFVKKIKTDYINIDWGYEINLNEYMKKFIKFYEENKYIIENKKNKKEIELKDVQEIIQYHRDIIERLKKLSYQIVNHMQSLWIRYSTLHDIIKKELTDKGIKEEPDVFEVMGYLLSDMISDMANRNNNIVSKYITLYMKDDEEIEIIQKPINKKEKQEKMKVSTNIYEMKVIDGKNKLIHIESSEEYRNKPKNEIEKGVIREIHKLFYGKNIRDAKL